MIDPRLAWFAMGATFGLLVSGWPWHPRFSRFSLRRRGSNPPSPRAKPPAPNSPPPIYGSYEFFDRAYLEFLKQRLLSSAPPPAVKRTPGPTLPDIPVRPRPVRPRPAGGRLIRGDRDPGKR